MILIQQVHHWHLSSLKLFSPVAFPPIGGNGAWQREKLMRNWGMKRLIHCPSQLPVCVAF